MRESFSPLQSSSSLILASMSREGDSLLVVTLFFVATFLPAAFFVAVFFGAASFLALFHIVGTSVSGFSILRAYKSPIDHGGAHRAVATTTAIRFRSLWVPHDYRDHETSLSQMDLHQP